MKTTTLGLLILLFSTMSSMIRAQEKDPLGSITGADGKVSQLVKHVNYRDFAFKKIK